MAFSSSSASVAIPEVTFSSGSQKIPAISFGTATSPFAEPEVLKSAVIKAIEIGYRHFDTAALYQTEQPLGEAIAEALTRGLIQTRDQLFVTSKLWITEAHQDLIVPALKETLGNLKLEYLDLYLIHWPVSAKPGPREYPPRKEELLAMDFKAVWAAMEKCKRLGLTKSIGVSNFSCKKISDLLVTANTPPAVNQVELNPVWQQKKLVSFCKEKGILVTAYSPLGASSSIWGSNRVMESQVLKDIAESKGKTVAQVCIKWAYEQGVVVAVKSFNEKRLRENLQIFDWELTDEDYKKIAEIPQIKACNGEVFIAPNGPYKSTEEIWDGEI